MCLSAEREGKNKETKEYIGKKKYGDVVCLHIFVLRDVIGHDMTSYDMTRRRGLAIYIYTNTEIEIESEIDIKLN